MSITVDAARSLTETELAEKIVVGKLVERDQPELGDCLRSLGQEQQAVLRAELAEEREQAPPAARKERP